MPRSGATGRCVYETVGLRLAGPPRIIPSTPAEGARVFDTGGVAGRERELATVTAFLDTLPSGPSGLLLEGEAGIGKTTVWDAGVAGAAARSYVILRSRPAESEVTLSFAAPADLGGVLSARLAALSDAVRKVLLATSCLRSPTTTLLERADGRSALAALQLAAVEGVVVVEGTQVRFTHPLLASAIYSGASPDQRRAAHRRLGLIAANVEERARHLALSSDGPDEDAAAALAKAARAAAARGAPATAAELAELAVTLTQTTPRS